MKIPLSNPDITELEKQKIFEVLETPNLSLGPKLKEFEKKFSDYIGTKFACAVNSGTSALHLCIRAINIRDNDEVITTPFSFIASANCILFERAKPIFIDIDEDTWNINVDNLSFIAKKRKKYKKLKAILPVHIFGRSCNMDDIMQVAKEYELKVIEDACEAVGAEYLTGKRTNNKSEKKKVWKKVGTFGDCGVYAFYPNKQITTGEGGMVVTDNKNIFNSCKSMRNQGRSEDSAWPQHERLGYNYRLSDIHCALGIAQLERIDEILKKRNKIANLYSERLKEIEEIITPHHEKNKKISWFVFVIRLIDSFSQDDRDLILDKLKELGIGCSNYFSPIHLQPFYRKLFGYKKGDYPITEKISERTIALPFYNNLKEEQIDYVCENLEKIIKSF